MVKKRSLPAPPTRRVAAPHRPPVLLLLLLLLTAPLRRFAGRHATWGA